MRELEFQISPYRAVMVLEATKDHSDVVRSWLTAPSSSSLSSSGSTSMLRLLPMDHLAMETTLTNTGSPAVHQPSRPFGTLHLQPVTKTSPSTHRWSTRFRSPTRGHSLHPLFQLPPLPTSHPRHHRRRRPLSRHKPLLHSHRALSRHPRRKNQIRPR